MSKLAAQGVLEAVRSEGGLLPPDILQRIAGNDPDLPGLTAQDYHLVGTETLAEAITGSWNHLVGLWQSLQDAVAKLGEGDHATRATRERFLLPLLQELGYGRLPKASAGTFQIEDRSYPISHLYQHTPIHLLGARVPLDRRTDGAPGAATASPHGLLQHFLNSSDAHLWGIVSNGRVLRVLRDHYSLTQQAYVEFDLESIFEGELFHAFRLLWLVCHQSRVEADRAEQCWLEKWFETAREEGVRALDHLREGVEGAIESFGQGFLRHASNTELQHELESGSLSPQGYYRELLRLVYRLIFLFVAEDREVLLDPHAPEEAGARYVRFYATKRMRDLSRSRRGTVHGDLWQGLLVSTAQLKDGCPSLGLPALGSFLWSDECLPHLDRCELSNEFLLEAIRHLSTFRDGKQLYPVNWRNVGSEELGSVYESLLELSPSLTSDGATFKLDTKPGHERKKTSSYYTRSSLVDRVLDSALNPVLDEAENRADAESSLLRLRICDPACGSGHFLVAAGRRIAHRLATIRSDGQEPAPQQVRQALRDVVGRCLFGVDLNPMAVELCKLSLWMEAIEPGKPLSFLDSHIQCGNALVGATPALLDRGIPDQAFTAIEEDDTKVASSLRRRNKKERSGQTSMLGSFVPESDAVVAAAKDLDEVPDENIEMVRSKERRWHRFAQSKELTSEWFAADAWCASFFWPKSRGELETCCVTDDLWRRLRLAPSSAPSATVRMVQSLAEKYHFFHWHLAFPQLFEPVVPGPGETDSAGWIGGFDVVLGNPPWDEVQFEETAWFASRDSEVAEAPNATERARRISALAINNEQLFAEYKQALRGIDGMKVFCKHAGLYPAAAQGKLNTYALFTEYMLRLVSDVGNVGCIVPTGIATDKNKSRLFESLMEPGRLRSLYDFVNERLLFPAIRPHQHFCLLTLGKPLGSDAQADFAAFLRDPRELEETERHYRLSWADISALNPNPETRVLSLFPSAGHSQVFRQLLAVFPPFGVQTGGGDWNPHYQQGLFNTASDSHWFKTEHELRAAGYILQGLLATGDAVYCPLYDAKMARQYTWRAASLGFTGHQFRKVSKTTTPTQMLRDPSFVPSAAYWVPREEVLNRLGDWNNEWLLGFKDVTGVTSTRLAAFAVVPTMGIGHPFPLLRVDGTATDHAFILAWMNSILVEFFLRLRMHGLHLTWHLLSQVPTPERSLVSSECPWTERGRLSDWLLPRVAELSVTSWSLAPFSKELGLRPNPYSYDPDRRFRLRSEIDAAWFVLAGMSERQVEFVLDSLGKIRAADERKFGEYRSKGLVLASYDRMQRAINTGVPYKSAFEPQPGAASLTHSQALK